MTVLGPRPAPAVGPRRAPAGPVTRPVRTRPARSPFTLTYLDAPTTVETPGIPTGTCLVLRNTGGRALRWASVTPVDGTVGARVGRPLPRHGDLGLGGREDVARLAAASDLFVDWVDQAGTDRSTWMRVPPVPARYR